MSYHAFFHSRSGTTRPVYAASFAAKSAPEARQKAMSNPGIKKFCGNQQTGDLVLMIHEAPTVEMAKEFALHAQVMA